MSFAETFEKVLLRGALPALAVSGFFGAVAIVIIGGVALATRDPDAAASVAAIMGLICLPLATTAMFATFAGALNGSVSVRNAVTEGANAGHAAGMLYYGFVALVFLGAGGMVIGLMIEGGSLVRQVSDVIAGLGVAALLLSLGGWIWSRNVALPLAALFVDRVVEWEAGGRAKNVFRRAPLGTLLLTNSPWLLMAAAIPVGPVQWELEAVLPANLLLVGRVAVTVVLLVATLMLHAAIAVSVYISARPEAE